MARKKKNTGESGMHGGYARIDHYDEASTEGIGKHFVDILKRIGQAFATPNEPSSDRHSRDLSAWPPFSDVRGGRGASVLIPPWRTTRAIRAPIRGHVSGTGWQILGAAIQSITTMMPVWQCGHSRNDWPVSASRRSRSSDRSVSR